MARITDRVAGSFVERLVRAAFEGVGPFAPAHEVADEALRRHGDPERAIDALVASHAKLAAAEGFLTGLGGFVTLPVALPANVVGFYTLATRLVAAIAHIRGHDLTQAETRVAILAALTGDRAGRLLERAGVATPGGRATQRALEGLSPSTAAMVNKAVGFRLLVGTTRRGLTRFGRAIPLAGGVVGGIVDLALLRSIANHAREQFPRTPPEPAAA